MSSIWMYSTYSKPRPTYECCSLCRNAQKHNIFRKSTLGYRQTFCIHKHATSPTTRSDRLSSKWRPSPLTTTLLTIGLQHQANNPSIPSPAPAPAPATASILEMLLPVLISRTASSPDYFSHSPYQTPSLHYWPNYRHTVEAAKLILWFVYPSLAIGCILGGFRRRGVWVRGWIGGVDAISLEPWWRRSWA